MQTQIFQFQAAQNVRVEFQNGEPLFCLKDVADILEIPRSSDLLQVSKGVVKNDTLKNRGGLKASGIFKIQTATAGGKQELTYINEPNLYRVIFRSNKAEAVKFQDWIFEEVIPQIRKTGSYTNPQHSDTLNAYECRQNPSSRQTTLPAYRRKQSRRLSQTALLHERLQLHPNQAGRLFRRP
ncbi:phage associated protein [Bergeriella denitrificans]|uniref:Phage associated protein n=1 Tax=Bergeriella denitrificans TaxID=494 RepID=A0A378UTG2_BERDE|nr:BRO family protein [Bergeriella denitrificans]STZ83000.1 phage associated protein [Bergeriella denitrificans]